MATLARHDSSVFRFAYTQKIRVWGAHLAPDATRPVTRAGLVQRLSGESAHDALDQTRALRCSAPSAGFARAVESSGEVRKGGDAPLRVS